MPDEAKPCPTPQDYYPGPPLSTEPMAMAPHGGYICPECKAYLNGRACPRCNPVDAPQPPGAAMRVDEKLASIIEAERKRDGGPQWWSSRVSDLLADRAEMVREITRLREALATILANLPTTTECQCQGDGGCVSCMVRKIIHRAGFKPRP